MTSGQYSMSGNQIVLTDLKGEIYTDKGKTTHLSRSRDM